jgi:hypothetical protein
MKDFARTRGRLRALSLHARLAYTVFLGFTAVAFGLTAWLLNDMVGLRLQRAAAYYAGEKSSSVPAAEQQPAPPLNTGGPTLDLPDDAMAASAASEAMPRRKLLEVTHFHLFTMPVYLLILSHLFMLSRAGSRFKTSTIVVATAGTALHVAAPWAATSGSMASIALYAVSGSAMGLSYMVMCVVPIWEMWLPDPPALSSDAVERPLTGSVRGNPESAVG